MPLRAKLEAGEVRTNANMMDSVSLDGVHLYNDAQMDPSANSYVPVIRGVANSNAKVTVRQEGRIVTQITVPPGPFAISDYYAAQNGSDLDVTVEESDGSTRPMPLLPIYCVLVKWTGISVSARWIKTRLMKRCGRESPPPLTV